MDYPWNESLTAFTEAADWFLQTAGQVGNRWEEPGLGDWDIRALVGHTSRSFLTVESYLATPAATAEIDGPAAYYRATRDIAKGPGVAERGRAAGAALGADPVMALADIAGRVRTLLQGSDGTELPTTIVGGMRLADYLPTRTFELTVHTADLCRALGIDADVPPVAAIQALRLVTELAIGDGRTGALVLVATGRPLPPGGLSVL